MDVRERRFGKHRAAAHKIDPALVPLELLSEARNVWEEALTLGERVGFRNSQATVLAPTGTIAFMMDCDTTGIEPDIALVKYKKLVGGGLLKIVNTTVPHALAHPTSEHAIIQSRGRRTRIAHLSGLRRRSRSCSPSRPTPSWR